ncbi:putative ATP binding protein [Leucosporidium creatinivorum]|uniref:Putative ATP binding protein n=1 Tax=Leucosporidium creatinivorum TaxID=106004 RepID=A0A1Y2FER0_9BASI|nr:putative ATP binding protein [Leucosporidium creatinivorum]
MDSLPDATLFQLVSSSALQGLLDKIVGPKTLVLSPSLAGPLGLVTEVGLLKNQHGVTKMFWLEPGALSQAERNIVYLCRPEVKWMKMIAGQPNRVLPAPNAHMYHLLVVPRMTTLCTSTLSELGVLGSIDVQEFQLGLIPLEKDLLSLEYEDVYRKLFLEGDYAPVYDMGKALMTIQRAFGLIPRIIGKGDQAKRLTDLLHRLRKELPLASPSSTPLANGTIDSMIVLDRQADMVTPLCTQLTYEGLVDEVIGIRNSHVDVDPNLLNPAPAASTSTPSASNFAAVPKKKKHLLSSSDSLFSELRDKNFAVVGSILNRTARRLNDDYERRHQAKTPAELRQFVGQLGGLQNEHQSLRLHTGLTEQIMAVTATDEFNTALEVQQNLIAGVDLPAQENSIRDLINQEAPLRTVLRLLCLYSVISGGLKPKVMEEFKREILQTYGFHHVPLLLSLHSLSLLTRSTPQKSPFSLARKPLRLVVDDVDEQDPTDISYVFSGYAPLSVRLVQAAITPASGGAGNGARANGSGGGGGNGSQLNGWKAVEEVLRPLPGLTFEDWQKEDESPHSRPPAHHQVPTTIVCFLGGVTYAEIAALRFLNKQTPGRNLLIVTTSCVQGSSLLTSLQPEATRASA